MLFDRRECLVNPFVALMASPEWWDSSPETKTEKTQTSRGAISTSSQCRDEGELLESFLVPLEKNKVQEHDPPRKPKSKKKKIETSAGNWRRSSWRSTRMLIASPNARHFSSPRTQVEKEALVREWMQCAQPRALHLFGTEAVLESILLKVVEGIDRYDDPVLDSDATCAPWYGDLDKDGKPAISVVLPGHTAASMHLVNCTLPFIFAVGKSFELN